MRSVEKALEESQLTGELRLGGRGIRELPHVSSRYSMGDVLIADVSKNRLLEVPPQLVETGASLEELDLYHNSIRHIPDTICKLRSLSVLNLSRNQLTYLPAALCKLPLQVLVVSYNKLVSLPEEIGQLVLLAELDAKCNEICQLPITLPKLENLVSLNLRRNCLQRLPDDIHCLTSLRCLDVAENLLPSLPLQMRLMSSLERLDVACNPLVFPPAAVCVRGRQHVFKLLEIRALRGEQEERARRGAAAAAVDEMDSRSARPAPLGGNVVESGCGSAFSPPPPLPPSSHLSGGGLRRSIVSSDAVRASPALNSTPHPSMTTDGTTEAIQARRFEPARSACGLSHAAPSPRTPCPVAPSITPQSSGRPAPPPPPQRGSATITPTTSRGSVQYSTPMTSRGSDTAPTLSAATSSAKTADLERLRREQKSVERLRQSVEDRLHVTLPDDIRSALMDGVVLCHLANHVRPRAVPSIHVPSPAVPQLNEAKCRRNLQNFLEACRMIGVEEMYLCRCADVFESQWLVSVGVMVDRLLRFAPPPVSPACPLQSNF